MKTVKTDIYFIDNDSVQLDNFRDNFKIDIDCKLYTFSSAEMFINKIQTDSKDKTFKIVIIDYLIKSRGMNTKTALELIPMIKTIDPDIEVIILADSDNISLKATSSNVSPAAFVKKDSRYYAILVAIINRLISEFRLKKLVRRNKLALLAFLIFLGIGILGIIYILLF